MRYDRRTGGAAALAFARRLTGEWYLFGGTAPGPTDCSGLWQWAYAQVGVELPRSTYGQFELYRIDKNAPRQAGDLLFIEGSDPGPAGEPGHVMGYVAPGVVFQAEMTGTRIGQYPYDTDVCDYLTRPALALPIPTPLPVPTPGENPTQEEITRRGLVGLHNPAEAELALDNGWPLFWWVRNRWAQVPRHPLPVGSTLYANKNFRTKRP